MTADLPRSNQVSLATVLVVIAAASAQLTLLVRWDVRWRSDWAIPVLAAILGGFYAAAAWGLRRYRGPWVGDRGLSGWRLAAGAAGHVLALRWEPQLWPVLIWLWMAFDAMLFAVLLRRPMNRAILEGVVLVVFTCLAAACIVIALEVTSLRLD
jgi:hypothetical protein